MIKGIINLSYLLMRIALSAIFSVLIVSLGVCVFISFKSRKPIGKYVAFLVGALIFPVTGNLFIISAPFQILSTVGCYIYFLGMDISMYAMVVFMYKYCNVNKKLHFIKYVVLAVMIADGIQLLCNVFGNHVFYLEQITVDDSIFYAYRAKIGLVLHRIADYTTLAGVLAVFVVKSITSPRVYAERYLVILFAMIAVAAWQTFNIFSRRPLDYSMLGFGVYGGLVFLLVIYYKPVRLLDRMLASIASKMPEALFFFDRSGRCIWANDKALEFFNLANDELDYAPNLLKEKFGDLRNKGLEWNENYVSGLGEDMKSYALAMHAVIDGKGRSVGYYLTIRDNSIEQFKIQQETYNATHDALTRVYNRAGYDSLIDNANLNDTFLLLIDIDSFKETNDKHGHNIGDKVLIKIASTIQKHFRKEDYVCRIGGDEFAIIIPGANKETSKLIKKRIDTINNELKTIEDDLPFATISAGGAYGASSENFLELFNDADHALYETKFKGKCGFTLFVKR